MADEKVSVVSVGEQQLALERKDRFIVCGLCGALLCVLAAATYTGLQLWLGTWALNRVAPGIWLALGTSGVFLTVFFQMALHEGWREALLCFSVPVGLVALTGGLGFLLQQYGLDRVLGGALIASPLLAAVGGWILWRRLVADPAGTALTRKGQEP